MDSATNASDDTPDGSAPGPSAYLKPPRHPEELGALGRYRVLKQLGAGGMGAVFLGFDEALDRKVALKVMLPKYAAQPTAKERFLREARAAAKVKSDHVITLHEVGEADGVPFIAMEYLQGQPLDEFLKTNGNPTAAQILRIGREVAAGLADAHALGLVHRDIKPANLWLEAPKGRVKILDFGLARQQTENVQLTHSGAVVGTPAFMSPEQALGKPLDGRSDLFSLGGVLYRLCTGRLPFPGQTQMEVLTRLAMEDPTPVRSVNSAVPEALARVIHKLLAKKAEDRYATADEVVRAVETIEASASGVALRAAAPIMVAAQAESVFDHLQDTSTQNVSPLPAPVKKAKAKPAKAPPWALVGGLAAGGVIVVVAAVVLFNKFKPKPPEPKPPEVEVVENKAKPIIVPKPKDAEPKPNPLPADAAFFTGKDLAGWSGSDAWSAADGGLTAGWNVSNNRPNPAQLASDRDYRDFEVSFKILIGAVGGSQTTGYGFGGLLVRATPMAGPHSEWAGARVNFGGPHWGTVSVVKPGPHQEPADRPDAEKLAPAGQYHAVTVKCVGRRVTVTVNGTETANTVFPELPAAGRVVWHLGPRIDGLGVRDVRFRDLSAAATVAGPWRPVFRTTTGEIKPRWITPGDTATFVWQPAGGEPVLRAGGRGTVLPEDKVVKNYHARLQFRWTTDKATSLELEFHRKNPYATNRVAWRCRSTGRDDVLAARDAFLWMDPAHVTPGGLTPAVGEPSYDASATVRPLKAAQEARGGWNTMELVCLGDSVVQVMNGQVVGAFARLRSKSPDGTETPRTDGLLSLSVFGEGLEVRRAEIRDITALPPEVTGTPDPERKAAALLNPHADLTLKLADGKTLYAKKAEPLPAAPFTVTKVGFPAGRKGPRFVAEVLIPAVADLSALTAIVDSNMHIRMTDAEFAQLGTAPTAKAMTHLQMAFQLNTRTLATLRNFPNLTGLGCYGEQEITDDLLEKLVAERPALTHLGLHVLKEAPNGPGMRAVAKLPLTSMGLADAQFFDPKAAQVIAGMPKLGLLVLNGAKITDVGVRELAASPSIHTITLDGAPITNDSLTALEGLKTLRKLEVRLTRVTAAGIATFKAARPDVTVVWDDPAAKK